MNCIIFEATQMEPEQMAALCKRCGIMAEAMFAAAVEAYAE